MLNAYPLRLVPQVKEVVWGGRWLADQLGRAGSPEARLGESWEAYSGSTVSNGIWQGRTLGELFQAYGAELAGSHASAYPKFPLLVKFIDAKQNLSVQVHPDNSLASQLEDQPFGKTEFWYVLQAEPAAQIYYGLNDLATRKEQLETAIQERDLIRYLQHTPVKAGDVVYIPAGTIHALTEGIVVYELQQDSDITYRLYDWGRTDRPIHIEKGLQAVKLEHRNLTVSHPEPVAQPDGSASTLLLENQYFAAELLSVQTQTQPTVRLDSFSLVSVLDGAGSLVSPDQSFATEILAKGDTVFMPAGLNYNLVASDNTPLKVITGWLN